MIQRYGCYHSGIDKHLYGRYVLHTDYLAEVAKLTEELERVRKVAEEWKDKYEHLRGQALRSLDAESERRYDDRKDHGYH